jgi:peptidoglycan L-alanyl-D-glutamate endopeptidase CwlK
MSRRIDDLFPFMAALAEALIERCALQGIRIQITSTLRTAEEQAAIYAQGREPLAEVNRLRREAGLMPITEAENQKTVTNARTSIHQFGLAFDVVVVDAHGRAVWAHKAYEPVGEIGEALGLEWGGRFRRFDGPHFQYTGGLTTAELAEGKRPEFATLGEARS